MRNRKEWMNKATDPILELLDESGLALSGKVLHHNIQRFSENPPGKSTVYRALEPLEENGYIKNSEGSETYYIITDKGREYLRSNNWASQNS